MARPKQPDFETLTHILSTNLSILRTLARLTQAELAAKAGVSRSLVQKIELAVQPGGKQAQSQLAKALNVELATLLSPQPPAPATSELALLEATSASATEIGAGTVTETEADKLASLRDLKNFYLWLAELNPTKKDLVQLKKLAQLYFQEK